MSPNPMSPNPMSPNPMSPNPMSQHPMSEKPLVVGLHAVLELAALVAVGYWGWATNDGVQRWVWAVAAPLLLGTLWAVFQAEADGVNPLVAVSGAVRLVLEVVLLGLAAALLYLAGQPAWSAVLAALVVLDYLLQRDRIGRLLGTR